MRTLSELFENNRRWAERHRREDPDYFNRLTQQQAPRYLWIGCSDSRVPANTVVGLEPGELFVHRNVANLVNHADMNCLSVVQYAVEVLRVEHIIVCGHYGCGGVRAAIEHDQIGLVDNWLRYIKDIYAEHHCDVEERHSHEDRINRLCELNVERQVRNLCSTTIVQNAWKRGQPVTVHGWIYDIKDGLLQDLGLCFDNAQQIEEIYRMERRSPRLLEGLAMV